MHTESTLQSRDIRAANAAFAGPQNYVYFMNFHANTGRLYSVFDFSHSFYRAKLRIVARYCHDKLSVRMSVCNVGALWSHALEFGKNNLTAD